VRHLPSPPGPLFTEPGALAMTVRVSVSPSPSSPPVWTRPRTASWSARRSPPPPTPEPNWSSTRRTGCTSTPNGPATPATPSRLRRDDRVRLGIAERVVEVHLAVDTEQLAVPVDGRHGVVGPPLPRRRLRHPDHGGDPGGAGALPHLGQERAVQRRGCRGDGCRGGGFWAAGRRLRPAGTPRLTRAGRATSGSPPPRTSGRECGT
jgi:hypothetical protein